MAILRSEAVAGDGGCRVSGAFINHRGIDSDSYSYVALLSYALCAGLPTEHVFLDSESIPPGADLVEALLRRLRGCDVLLTLIGLDRLAASDEVGRRIIDAPVDWIHRELVVVNRAGVRVIPVLTDGAEGARPAFATPATVPSMPWIDRPERGWLAGSVRAATRGDNDGVTVRVTRKGFRPFSRATRLRTDGNGYFGLANVRPGRYEIAVTAGGATRRLEVRVVAGKVARADL